MESANLLHLIRYPNSLMNLIIMNFCWFSFSMAYFGLAYNIPTFGLDVRIVFTLPSFLFVPLMFFNPWVENKLGRKATLSLSLLTCGMFLFLTLCVPKGVFAYNWPIIGFLYMGLYTCGLAFNFGYSFTRELFPTSLRTSALGLASSAARVGSMASAGIASLEEVNILLPSLIYGAFCIAASVWSIWLWPETTELNLPDTLEEAERNASTRNTWLLWKRKTRKVGITKEP